jgi:hypothetical protein
MLQDLLVIVSIVYALTKFSSIFPILGYWWLRGLSFIQRPRDEEVAHLDENDPRKKHFIITQSSDQSKEKKVPLKKNLIIARWGVLNVNVLESTYKGETLRFITLLTQGVLCGYILHYLILGVKYFFELRGNYQTSLLTTAFFATFTILLNLVVMIELFALLGVDSNVWKLSVIVGIVGIVVMFFFLEDPEFFIDIPLIRGFEHLQDLTNSIFTWLHIPFVLNLPDELLRIFLSVSVGVMTILHFFPVFQTTVLHFRILHRSSTSYFVIKLLPYLMWVNSVVHLTLWLSPVVDFLESYRDEEVEEREGIEVAYRTTTLIGWFFNHLVNVFGPNIYHRLRIIFGVLHLLGHILILRSALQAKLWDIHRKIKMILSLSGNTRFKIGRLIQDTTSRTVNNISYFALLTIVVPLFQFWLIFFNGIWFLDFLYFSSLLISTVLTTVFGCLMWCTSLNEATLIVEPRSFIVEGDNEKRGDTVKASDSVLDTTKKRTQLKQLSGHHKSTLSSTHSENTRKGDQTLKESKTPITKLNNAKSQKSEKRRELKSSKTETKIKM